MGSSIYRCGAQKQAKNTFIRAHLVSASYEGGLKKFVIFHSIPLPTALPGPGGLAPRAVSKRKFLWPSAYYPSWSWGPSPKRLFLSANFRGHFAHPLATSSLLGLVAILPFGKSRAYARLFLVGY